VGVVRLAENKTALFAVSWNWLLQRELPIVILSGAKDPCSLYREAKDPSLRSG